MLTTADLAAIQKKSKRDRKPLKPLPPLDKFIDATRSVDGESWARLVLPYPPSTNDYYRRFRGMTVIDKEGKRYKKFVLDLALVLGRRPINGPVQVIVDQFRPQKSGDIDNCLKCTLDSVKGIAWMDDSQIKNLCVNQFDDPAFPRIVLRVRIRPGETLNFDEFFN